MSPLLAQRQIALAAVALLAVVVALALVALAGGARGESEVDRHSVPVPGTGWYTALAAPFGFPPEATRTTCGFAVRTGIPGLAHPVLPCGARIVIDYEGVQILTQVVDRGSGAPGREFEATPALAERLRLHGVQEIRWRFAR